MKRQAFFPRNSIDSRSEQRASYGKLPPRNLGRGSANSVDEGAQGHQLGANCLRILPLKTHRYYKSQVGRGHLRKLIFRDAFLQSHEVLPWDAICLIENLAPPILAGRLRRKHPNRRLPLSIRSGGWKQEVGLLVSFGHLTMRERQAFLSENSAEVELQRSPGPGFRSVGVRVAI